jgi:hypothetical protein
MGLIFLPSWSSMFSSAMIVSWGGVLDCSVNWALSVPLHLRLGTMQQMTDMVRSVSELNTETSLL